MYLFKIKKVMLYVMDLQLISDIIRIILLLINLNLISMNPMSYILNL
jgi:hypothetical protein